MVNPDQKIDPNKEVYRSESAQETRRKAPLRDFRDVAEQVDEKRYKDEEEQLKAKKKKGSTQKTDSKSHQPLLSPFDLARELKDSTHEEEEDSHSPSESSMATLEKKRRENDIYSGIEQPDLSSSINLASPQTVSGASSIENKTPLLSTTPIQEIIDQIAKEVYILKDSGRTEIVVPLKGNFEGSNLMITENSSAPGEINVTIDNLTAVNQYILEKNKHVLIDELANKNVVVHIFTASTTQETPRTAYTAEDSNRNPRERNREHQREQQQQDS